MGGPTAIIAWIGVYQGSWAKLFHARMLPVAWIHTAALCIVLGMGGFSLTLLSMAEKSHYGCQVTIDFSQRSEGAWQGPFSCFYVSGLTRKI